MPGRGGPDAVAMGERDMTLGYIVIADGAVDQIVAGYDAERHARRVCRALGRDGYAVRCYQVAHADADAVADKIADDLVMRGRIGLKAIRDEYPTFKALRWLG